MATAEGGFSGVSAGALAEGGSVADGASVATATAVAPSMEAISSGVSISANPLSDPGWSMYSPAMDAGAMSEVEGRSVVSEAVEVAQHAWEQTEFALPQVFIPTPDATAQYLTAFGISLTPETSQASEEAVVEVEKAAVEVVVENLGALDTLNESSDEVVAQNAIRLAQEVRPDLVSELLQLTDQKNESLGKDLVEKAELVEEVVEPDVLDQEVDAEEVPLSEEAEEVNHDETVQEPIEEDDDMEKRPPEDRRQDFRVASGADSQREKLLKSLAEEGARVSNNGGIASPQAIAEGFIAGADRSPARAQLGIMDPNERGVAAIGNAIRQMSPGSTQEGIVTAGRRSMEVNSAVVLSEAGAPATQIAIESAVGSRRNPFAQAA